MNFVHATKKYRSIVNEYREVISSNEFVVDSFQNGESYSKCLFMTILDFAQSISIASSNGDYISPPISLRSMAEAYIKLFSLRKGGTNVQNFELSGLGQRGIDINSFFEILNEDAEYKEQFSSNIEKCTKQLAEIEQAKARLKEGGAKDIKTARLFANFKLMRTYNSSYRPTNTFVHSDIFSLEHRHMNEKKGEFRITPTFEKEEGRVFACMVQGAHLLLKASEICSDIISSKSWSANLDSRTKSFIACSTNHGDDLNLC